MVAADDPSAGVGNDGAAIRYHNMERKIETSADGLDPAAAERVMLLRGRKSRIYYLRRFFDYPITLSKNTLVNLGLWRTTKIGVSYLKSAAFPQKEEHKLEQFFINRFGKELYNTFFKSYTEKVWGVPCTEISAEWGAQRIKGLSIVKTIQHAVKKAFGGSKSDIGQKGTETSLIEQFLYPKFGPGQMWEETARRVKEMGGDIRTGYKVERILTDGWRVTGIEARNLASGQTRPSPAIISFPRHPSRNCCAPSTWRRRPKCSKFPTGSSTATSSPSACWCAI